ncbi:hypothetical protein DRP77_00880 [Candidatus Poribacteria bacterium]|nr:MAG: hypothetical protein DRP77_00880 [Candidatus Poribacteria bacterium]
MWFWHEGEHYVRQSGSTGFDRKAAASGGYCLGAGWGSKGTDYVEYEIEIPTDTDVHLHIRYAKGEGEGRYDVLVDGKLVGRSPTLTLSPTGGWGDRPEDWKFASVHVGVLRGGKHVVRIQSKQSGNRLNIDGFFVADPDFEPPEDFDAFLPSIEENILERAREMTTHVDLLQTPRQPRKPPRLEFEEILQLIKNAPPELAHVYEGTALKPSPYLLKSYDVGKPIDYAQDFVWHLLKKESEFDIPKLGNVGLINPNTDIAYLIGIQLQGEDLRLFHFSDTRIHLIDLYAEEIRVAEGLTATVIFIPYDGATLMTAVIVENESGDTRYLNVYQITFKEPPEDRPVQRYGRSVTVSTGKMRWTGYNNNNDALVACYDEWVGPNAERPLGKLIAVMTSTEKPSGHLFRNELTGAPIARMHPIRYEALKYRVTIRSGEKKLLLFSLALCRYSNYPLPEIRGVQHYPQMSDEEALIKALRQAWEPFESDWQGQVKRSIERYRSFPKVVLPAEGWDSSFYACLELPRAETYSPYLNMPVPFYNFCRAHAQQPYGWWTYGEHAHESLSIFTTVLTDPKLAQDHIKGHIIRQTEDGMYPYGVNQLGVRERPADESTCPLIVWEAWNAYLWSGDAEFLREAYESGKRNHRWWMENRDRTGKGLNHWRDYHETVRDDPDLPTWTATGGAMNQEALDLNCYLLVQERTLAEMAKELGLEDEAKEFEEMAGRRASLMNELMWHEEDGCYYGRDLKTGRWVRVRDISTFLPLWAGLATPERAESIIRYLDDPNEFKTAFPVPTLSVSDPTFGPDKHWHGGNWVEMTWLVIQGLRRYGHYSKAAELAYINAKMVFDVLQKTGHFREYYNSVTGEPASGSLYDYIWSCLPAAFIVNVFFGVEPRREGLEIRPALPEGWERISIENLIVRGKRISLTVERSDRVRITRVTLNGQGVRQVGNRGAFIPWDRLRDENRIEIVQPVRIKSG